MTSEEPESHVPSVDERRPELVEETRRIWNAMAEWWDDRIGDGNDFQLVLLEPTTERLLGDIRGQTILDLGCGAGRFARRMAELGAKVTAVDFSERFINRARQRTPAEASVDYHVVDATDEAALLALSAGQFDQAVATMLLQDLVVIEPLFRAVPVLLKPGGHFTFTITHPCFQPPGMVKFAEAGEEEGILIRRNGVKVSQYRTSAAFRGIGIVGQTEPQYYFHRPLSEYLRVAFAAGFVVDGFEEPAFPADGAKPGGLRWNDMPEVPPVAAVRLSKGN